ncbi:MAG: DUF4314 domain-containing protein [Candidatus Cryptobacteroides sp.]
MNNYREAAALAKKYYHIGDRIRIMHLRGEDARYDGREGEITYIDDAGQIHGTWGGLAVIVGVDRFTLLPKE